MQDSYEQDLRYVLGTGVDDNGHVPEGKFDNWNWEPTALAGVGKALQSPFPYVYSYGEGNQDGMDDALWIYDNGKQD